jgi:hypothetical protein
VGLLMGQLLAGLLLIMVGVAIFQRLRDGDG